MKFKEKLTTFDISSMINTQLNKQLKETNKTVFWFFTEKYCKFVYS